MAEGNRQNVRRTTKRVPQKSHTHTHTHTQDPEKAESLVSPAIWFSVEGGGSWGRQGWEEVWEATGQGAAPRRATRPGEARAPSLGLAGTQRLGGQTWQDVITKSLGGLGWGEEDRAKAWLQPRVTQSLGGQAHGKRYLRMLGGGGLPGLGGLRPGHWRPTGNLSHPEGEGLLALRETGKRHGGGRWAGQHAGNHRCGLGKETNVLSRVDGRDAEGPEPREGGTGKGTQVGSGKQSRGGGGKPEEELPDRGGARWAAGKGEACRSPGGSQPGALGGGQAPARKGGAGELDVVPGGGGHPGGRGPARGPPTQERDLVRPEPKGTHATAAPAPSSVLNSRAGGP